MTSIEPGTVQKPFGTSTYGRIADKTLYGYADRITPSGRGIPAQASVLWDDGGHSWELVSDLRQRFRRPPRQPGEAYAAGEF